MTSNYVLLKALERANDSLLGLVGEDVDAIEVKSVRTEEAPFLAKIVSKLSPMVGNLMEQRIVDLLDLSAPRGFSWHRQDPGFPDAILADDRLNELTNTGYEIKAWYVLSTEITGRFRESQHLLAEKNINVAVVAWCMSHLIYGKPKILGVLTVSGRELAESRDLHYHQPPDYLIIEPQDTSARTANLRQSNVNGYKLQEADSDPMLLRRARARYSGARYASDPHSPESQAEAADLMNELQYRLDTNFAKIDRVGHPDVEEFKQQVLGSEYLGRTFNHWKNIFRDLNSTTNDMARSHAERLIVDLYGQMVRAEPQTEILVESEDVQ
ncbi:hypothetical protein [Arthrobacter sp. 162MFSha1.1]|uniref:hypothetical protein n=1 Tax=Arthrobacter sp. 162MFSha1.1 TaxID=1151119 RepID=UPI0012DC4255|nr:hypothetical protein [Arthrobacter sp. 162MFSha1.1]